MVQFSYNHLNRDSFTIGGYVTKQFIGEYTTSWVITDTANQVIEFHMYWPALCGMDMSHGLYKQITKLFTLSVKESSLLIKPIEINVKYGKVVYTYRMARENDNN